MRFEDVYGSHKQKKLTCEQAAELLGICERTFRRQIERYEEDGMKGLLDKRLGKIAHNAAPVDEVIELLNLYESDYYDFSASHFYDMYRHRHKGTRSYTWVKKQLQNSGHIEAKKRKGTHRKRRPRRPYIGMMLHQDGSTHNWLANETSDLIVTLDDANNQIYTAILVEEEGTWSSFQGIKPIILEYGLFCSFYTDRGSHYWTTLKAGEKVDLQNLTQFGRAMEQLGIEMIAAYSPEARGRSERMFGTLQNRLPKELRLEGIVEKDKANIFIKEKFLPEFNLRFMKEAQEEESAFVPWTDSAAKLENILCIQEERTVNKDNTVSYKNKKLQIPKTKDRCHYMRVKVKIHEYEDGSLAIYHGPRELGRYDHLGNIETTESI